MCDTMVLVEPGRVLFAKNSDRDPNEGQALEWHGPARHAPGTALACTWITIPQVAETLGVVISRPSWMWGAEMGANEAGVVIGNEAVFTNQPHAKTGLTGMDLVRLGLERGASARKACEVLVALLESHGQGGGCGFENRRFTYHNSFIIADPKEAYVLETAGKHHAIEVVEGRRSISNGLSIPGFAARFGETLRTGVSACRIRQARTGRLLQDVREVGDLFGILRDHGEDTTWPRYHWVNGGMAGTCMHGGGLIAASQTTGSWVSELRAAGALHWVTATAAPCTSLFKPIRYETPVDLGAAPGEGADDSFWWRHEVFHRQVMVDPPALFPVFMEARDKVERAWLDDPPAAEEAFAKHRSLLQTWTNELAQWSQRTVREPWYIERYWRKRNRQAGL